jgi:hypothetical protein
MGIGKTRIELRSEVTSTIVERTRSCIAAGCCSRMTAALPSVSAASYSPCAWMTLARRYR